MWECLTITKSLRALAEQPDDLVLAIQPNQYKNLQNLDLHCRCDPHPALLTSSGPHLQILALKSKMLQDITIWWLVFSELIYPRINCINHSRKIVLDHSLLKWFIHYFYCVKSTFVTHTSVDSIDNDFPLLYYNSSYLKSQNHSDLVCFENKHFFLPVSIEQDAAISIPRSPFGSFFVKDSTKTDQFPNFIDQVRHELKDRSISSLKVIHPAAIYDHFVTADHLLNAGFQKDFDDINQYIPLKSGWLEDIHDMQKRKLASLKDEGFSFRKMESSELQVAHQFVEVCRLTQELSINISYEQLKELSDQTGAYDIFGVFRSEKISALCISARVTEKTAYYYLPATSPLFRSQSPMVLLITGMVEYYQSQRCDYFDLGVSSVEGKPQESLRIFKERMGAIQGEKSTLSLQI